MVYDRAADLTWLIDWNAAAGSAFDDGSSAQDGRMSWASAMAWADALQWGGVDDWRLPTAVPCFGFGCQNSEIGRLWYEVLGNRAGLPAVNTEPFEHVAFAPYWTGTAQAGAPAQAWYFNTLGGSQNLLPLAAQAHAVAVRQGDVLSQVPEPPMAWLALAGLAITACASRRLRPAAQP
ncbi:hypothetical protein IP87_18915 [beta proteobacterium AAP121]|nr:hypothetical protein IP80_12735 [beta proteobacterium AAP65]KPF94510.1 hypothetical protein IP87_18915 [beta proteobacterium AAP121]